MRGVSGSQHLSVGHCALFPASTPKLLPSLHPLTDDRELAGHNTRDVPFLVKKRDQPSTHIPLAFGPALKIHSAVQQQSWHEVADRCLKTGRTIRYLTGHRSRTDTGYHRHICLIHTGNHSSVNGTRLGGKWNIGIIGDCEATTDVACKCTRDVSISHNKPPAVTSRQGVFCACVLETMNGTCWPATTGSERAASVAMIVQAKSEALDKAVRSDWLIEALR